MDGGSVSLACDPAGDGAEVAAAEGPRTQNFLWGQVRPEVRLVFEDKASVPPAPRQRLAGQGRFPVAHTSYVCPALPGSGAGALPPNRMTAHAQLGRKTPNNLMARRPAAMPRTAAILVPRGGGRMQAAAGVGLE
eukprot:CAMPEP_0175752832 /NCGR_PEP_ID=MMETSP0097-20121207/61976_1 /TAXON_ID=311494 /ORGANISM="Alexandrium monilatum, Strain CCMP3105" /LENGTH=134 /DNA_ID=CAMNT_0017061645 /DNA_START=491 /DNA_END=893 /DNA_ORIENTATION=+